MSYHSRCNELRMHRCNKLSKDDHSPCLTDVPILLHLSSSVRLLGGQQLGETVHWAHLHTFVTNLGEQHSDTFTIYSILQLRCL